MTESEQYVLPNNSSFQLSSLADSMGNPDSSDIPGHSGLSLITCSDKQLKAPTLWRQRGYRTYKCLESFSMSLVLRMLKQCTEIEPMDSEE